MLAKGEVKRGLVATIPEGWRSEQIADRLQATGFASRDDFLKAVAAPQSVPGVGHAATAERRRASRATCFPRPMRFPRQVSGSRAAELMVRMFSQRVGDVVRTPSESKLTPQQVLTLASIVEREAKVPSERAMIACVYLNRLAPEHAAAGRPDGAVRGRDARRQRGGSLRLLEARLTPDDLKIDSPYNTYRAHGFAARPDLQSGRGVDPRRAAARPDGLPVLRRQQRRQRHPPLRAERSTSTTPTWPK